MKTIPIHTHSLWERMRRDGAVMSVNMEITARCNLNCRHCYINRPATDTNALRSELSAEDIREIASESASLGAIWCLISGGEPLLREDFEVIYRYLKEAGLLVSVFTNATLLTSRHARLFRNYPPNHIEVTVYGASRAVYERITRQPGAYDAMHRGLDRLNTEGVPVDLKAMALRSNRAEMPEIARFCRERSAAPFRFDPLLHLRYDQDAARNREIIAERLCPEDIADVERGDQERYDAMRDGCDRIILGSDGPPRGDAPLFRCGAGRSGFAVSADGKLRLCASLCHPDCEYDLKAGSVTDAWLNFVPAIRALRSAKEEYLTHCAACPLINLCLWCPAHAYLETGELDAPVEAFCQVARARAALLPTEVLNST